MFYSSVLARVIRYTVHPFKKPKSLPFACHTNDLLNKILTPVMRFLTKFSVLPRTRLHTVHYIMEGPFEAN